MHALYFRSSNIGLFLIFFIISDEDFWALGTFIVSSIVTLQLHLTQGKTHTHVPYVIIALGSSLFVIANSKNTKQGPFVRNLPDALLGV